MAGKETMTLPKAITDFVAKKLETLIALTVAGGIGYGSTYIGTDNALSDLKIKIEHNDMIDLTQHNELRANMDMLETRLQSEFKVNQAELRLLISDELKKSEERLLEKMRAENDRDAKLRRQKPQGYNP